MKMDSYNSQKLRILSCLLILLVLYIHSFYLEAVGSKYASFVQLFLGGGGLANIAVPMFFVFSGFLFFLGVKEVKECIPKIRKRVRSLMIPYLIWNVVFVLWYIMLQNLPGISSMVNSDILAEITYGNLWNNFYTVFVSPIAFHLWFIRDLMIMVMLSPLIYLGVKKTRWYGAALMLMLHPWLLMLSKTFNQFGIAYFILGGTIALCSDLNRMSKKISFPVFAISLSVWLLHALLQVLEIKVPFLYWGVISVLAGIISVWKLYDIFASRPKMESVVAHIKPILGYSFFVYLFHEPVFNIIKKIGVKVLGGVGDGALIILFLINPLIMYAVAVMVAKLMQRFAPRVYGVLVGGR